MAKQSNEVGVGEAAEILGVSRRTVERWVRTGLPAHFGGGALETTNRVPEGVRGRKSHRFARAYLARLARSIRRLTDAA